MSDLLILVDKDDIEVGSMEKMQAHQQGILHRAFSIFIFNGKGELLLQRRNIEKYHSAGLWSNTCCSHPRLGEQTLEAAHRRLMEEMGLQSKMEFEFSFIYNSQYENGLTEHEFDHVFFGYSDQLPEPNKDEVMDWKYMSIKELQMDLQKRDHIYTSWLKICFPKIIAHLNTFKSFNL